ncbi:L-threonine synthase [Halovenus aranensis]|jgi:threonine synthase|uniref:L-threonine synthase n=1 Tax=Halovenus aranensis TaxID=890420 RepID=A0A1G8S7E4_9EURY|nr:threonine synthase [Halovenus aranensis]SDJ24600.1 L-threonine synthase [Halovenus aranensis]
MYTDGETTGTVVSHLTCRSCGATYDLDLTDFPCRECGGILDPKYDYDALDITPEEWAARGDSMWDYRELLPVRDPDAIVSMGEGATPLVDAPGLADDLGIDSLWFKDEGQNPTNTFKDRGQAAAVSCANEQDVTDVALNSAGNAGQSASAYAARAGMDCHVFLNHQAGPVKKDLVRAHGANLHLSDGKIGDAGAAFTEAREEHGWYSVKTFQTPYRHEGKKTMGYEVFEAFDWEAPDHIVYPTGGGVGLIGIWKAYQELRELGWLAEDPPKLHVAQTSGAAPVVEAIEAGRQEHEPWDDPDSIARGVEIPDPGASPWMLEAVFESGGTGVAVSDEDAFDASLVAARQAGVEMCVTSAVALAGTMELAAEGVFGPDESVVVINTGAGAKTASKIGKHAKSR